MNNIKCDIIIPIWNERELTRICIESITKNTDVSFRVILVDNASDTETASYLKELSEKNKGAIILIRNEENFIWFAINSVIDYVDEIMVWDMGSIDKTEEIVKSIDNPKIKYKKVRYLY